MKSFSIVESRVGPAVKGLGQLAAGSAVAMVQEINRQEIEQAVDNVKRTKLDKWFRRQWYRAAAISRWSDRRRFAWKRANRLQGGKRRTRK